MLILSADSLLRMRMTGEVSSSDMKSSSNTSLSEVVTQGAETRL